MIGACFCRKARCCLRAFCIYAHIRVRRHPELPKSCLRTCQDVVRRTPARSSFNYCHHHYNRAIISHRDRTTLMNYYYYCRYTYARHGECPPPTIRGLLDQSMQQSEPYTCSVDLYVILLKTAKNYFYHSYRIFLKHFCYLSSLRKREEQQFPSAIKRILSHSENTF